MTLFSWTARVSICEKYCDGTCSEQRNTHFFRGSSMHLIALAVLALVLGFVHSFLQPKLANVLPASFSQNTWGRAFFTGAFILVSFFIASLAVGTVFKGKSI